jgi:hypothetical protein
MRMNNDDTWTGIGTAISAFGATVSALYSNPIISSLFTFLVGAFVTFFVQSKLQDRSEKRKLRVTNIEELHIPLYLEIENIKEKLLLALEEYSLISSKEELLSKPQMFSIPHELRTKINLFLSETENLQERMSGAKGIATKIISQKVTEILLPKINESSNLNYVSDLHVESMIDGNNLRISIERPNWIMYAPITEIAILDGNPISYLKSKYQAFNADEFFLTTNIKQYGVAVPMTKTLKFNLYEKNGYEVFSSFWKEAIFDIQKNPDIATFNSIREKLIPFCDEISLKLKKYIEKYVLVENELIT